MPTTAFIVWRTVVFVLLAPHRVAGDLGGMGGTYRPKSLVTEVDKRIVSAYRPNGQRTALGIYIRIAGSRQTRQNGGGRGLSHPGA